MQASPSSSACGPRPSGLPRGVPPIPHAFTAHITFLEPLGSDTLVFFRLGRAEIIARLPPLAHLKEGQDIALTIDPSKIHLFDAETERALVAPAAI